MNRQQLPIKGRVTALSWGKFGGVKGEREPVAMLLLLKDSTNVGVRGISGKTAAAVGLGWERRVAWAKADLAAWKDVAIEGVQWRVHGEP